MFALMIGLLLEKTVSEFDEKVALAVTGSTLAPNLMRFLEENDVAIQAVRFDLEQARIAIRNGRHEAILIIPAEYPQRLRDGLPAPVQLVSDSADNRAGKYVARIRALIGAYGSQLASSRLLARGINAQLMRPIAVDEVDVSTPAGRALLVLGMMTYFVLFAMLMGGLYLAIDATAGERERGSLEPLLTIPAPRSQLIYGKILATCCFMLLSLAITLTAFTVGIKLVPLESLGMSANFGPGVALRVFAVAVPFALLGASLMTVVASFTRTYKEAQGYLTLVLLIPTLPIVFAGLYALRPSNLLMAVPSLSQHLLMTGLIRDEPLPALQIAISALTTLAAGLLLAWVAGRLYEREAILG
jgi:sodium transport system permease protein